MAKMLPDVPPETIEYGSERVVYEALRDQLPSSYTVMHSYPWLRRQGKPLREGEADFVILNRERGLLVLEVKGGELVLQGQTWYREKTSGRERIRDPFEQAKRNMHALLERLEQHSGRSRADWHMVYGYAVVFPHHHYRGVLPANADKAIIISQPDLENIGRCIQQAYDAWTLRPSPLPEREYRTAQQILLPHFKLIRSLGPEMDLASQKLLQLTEDQQIALEGLYANTRVLVAGAAGTGKTMLALQRALDYAQQGLKCLFVCFNVELAKWLSELVANDPMYQIYAAQIHIWNFHRLARHLAQRAGVVFEVPQNPMAEQVFWDDEVPNILEQAAMIMRHSGDFLYDAIVVDEAQDFCELWWYSLTESFLQSPEDGPLYVFYDPHQTLRERAAPPPIKFATQYTLAYNCRNTQRIAKTSAAILNLSAQVFTKSPIGEYPILLEVPAPGQQRRIVVQQLKRLLNQEHLAPDRIVLIGPRRRDSGSLADMDECAGIPLTTSAEEWRQGKGILVTTTRSFKGLEADVVILYDIGKLRESFNQSDLYVACTRARHLLILLTHDQAVKEQIEAGPTSCRFRKLIASAILS